MTPGIIDPHSHMALDDDVNEATSPVVPQMMMKDAFDYNDKAIYRALAGGVTSSLLLHGSADMIGGQAVVIKNKYGLDRDQMLFPGAPQSIKFASGENPKRVFGDKKQLPSTRMGNFEVMREAFTQAKDYQRSWDEYNEKVKKGDKTASAPKKDLKLEALVQVLQGKMLVQIHCYRSDELLTEIAIANEFGYKIRAFHHALEAYKVPDFLAKKNIAIATFADWWGFKYEAWDAIPWNAVIAMRHGVKVAIKSDSERLHAAAEPRGGQDDALRRRHRRRGDADADDQSGVDYGSGRQDGIDRCGQRCGPGVVERVSAVDLRYPGQGVDRWRSVLRSWVAGVGHAAVPGGTVMTKHRFSLFACRLPLIAFRS